MTAIAQDPAEVAEIADCILISAERLEKLIDKFLLHGQLSSFIGNSQKLRILQVQPCSVSEIVTLRSQQQAEKADRLADLDLNLPITDELLCSQFSLSKIVDELVENAFKFSVSGDRVQISCQTAQNWLVLTVVNQGRGMTPHQITDINAYRQFDRTHYEQQGLGLGLAIAQKLAELQGGTLELKSMPGIEITVTVRLPIAPPAIAASGLYSQA
ncbi:MAG: ATP-binding protein [Leptolyngbyaceae cyanobacterium SM1_1_3]|nr:ATP-binding protein [Leptolyngbyaceae cyanobacterium SM1_1_3]NJO11581.1 ATP-binding protein [Leptolyngbyaceae cyanobacterium SL_1_1]